MILGCVSKHCPFQFSPCTRAYLSKGLSGKPGMFTRISPSWQALNSVFFFFWRGALLNTMRFLKSLLGLLASFYLASYNVALANALRRKAVKNVQLITSSLFTSFHMWPLVSWVLWLLIDAFKKLGFTPTSIYSFVFYSPFIVVWGGGWLDTCYSILAGVGAKLSLIFFAICIFI